MALSQLRRKHDKVMEKVTEACERAIDRIIETYKVNPLAAGYMLVQILDTHVAVELPTAGNEPPRVQPYAPRHRHIVGDGITHAQTPDNAPAVLERKQGFDKGAWGGSK